MPRRNGCYTVCLGELFVPSADINALIDGNKHFQSPTLVGKVVDLVTGGLLCEVANIRDDRYMMAFAKIDRRSQWTSVKCRAQYDIERLCAELLFYKC